MAAHAAGDLVINEHDEGDPTADEELLLVLRGHAIFEVAGDRVDAMSEEWRESARSDSGLDRLRDEPVFQELIRA